MASSLKTGIIFYIAFISTYVVCDSFNSSLSKVASVFNGTCPNITSMAQYIDIEKVTKLWFSSNSHTIPELLSRSMANGICSMETQMSSSIQKLAYGGILLERMELRSSQNMKKFQGNLKVWKNLESIKPNPILDLVPCQCQEE